MIKLASVAVLVVSFMGDAIADVVYPSDVQRMQTMMYSQQYANPYRQQQSMYPVYPQTQMMSYPAASAYTPYSSQQYPYSAWNQSAWSNPWQSTTMPMQSSQYVYPQSMAMYPQQYMMQRPQVSSVQRPPVQQRAPVKPAPKKTKAWGDVRNIWPDFYTDFTDEAWDWMIGSPRDMGYMPGGWRFPYISMPDPVTVADAVANQIPPIMEEVPNFAPVPSQY